MGRVLRWTGRILGGLVILILIAAFGAWLWFWGRPVGVNNYINKITAQFLLDSPEMLSSIGVIDNTPLDFHSGKLNDYTRANDDKQLARLKKARKGLDKYGPDGLEGQELLSWQITAWFFDDLLRQAEFEHSAYRINQISGVTINMPQFLTDTHVIKNKKSARRYLSRLNDFGRVLDEVHARIEDDRAHGVIAPDFIIRGAINSMQNFIAGGADKNPLVTTLSAKLDRIDGLSTKDKRAILDQAITIVRETVIPGYERMIAQQQDLLKSATHDAGIWHIPDGDKIYAAALHSNTTTDMSADEIHNLGLAEVARIEKEMDDILRAQGLTDGTVAERVNILMQDPRYLFDDSDAGRAEQRAYLKSLYDRLMAKAGDYFLTLPPQPLEIVRVPEYAQDSAPGGYYRSPALDGSKPGRFYINQKSMKDNPKWTLPTLIFHEGAPGHHFQLSRAQMIKHVPLLRKMGPFNAYGEGWALYAERIAATDMGMYDRDPLGNLGRLQAEMFRAVRLVVDTGIHAKHWSRERAIEYMRGKTGMTEDEVTREIERYVVWPGQATSYKVGQLKILALRKRAEDILGDTFDLRQFNELILKNGAMPLGILDRVVDEWIGSQK